jgi:hypothetical protein
VSGLLRFLLFFSVLVGLLVLVGVPAAASPVLTQMVRDAGLRADEMTVSVAYFDPSLLWGRSEELTIQARGARLGPATAGGLDIALGDVALLDRTFESISGNVRDIALRAGGLDVLVDRIEIDGPAQAASVAAYLTPEQSAAVVRQAAALVGVELRDVVLVDGAVRVRLGPVTTEAALSVEGGALVLTPPIGPALLLLQPAPSDPWRLTGAQVSRDGVVLRGVVDAEAIARRVGSE